jgi:hypothetical protein
LLAPEGRHSVNIFISKGGEIMKENKIDHLVGIYEKDGSVKCRECMEDNDWKELREDNIITEDYIKKADEWIYCDYCEKRL